MESPLFWYTRIVIVILYVQQYLTIGCISQSNFLLFSEKSCLEILQKSRQNKEDKISGEYTIKISDHTKPLNVFCDMETDGGKDFEWR